MTIREGLRKSQLTISILITTILIVPLQTWLLFPVTIQSFLLITKAPANYFPNASITFPSYFLLTIVYCIFVSLFFKPKRIISPINVQIFTVVAFSILMIFNSFQISMTPEKYTNFFFSLIFIAVTLIIIGFVQLFVVRWVTGLNDGGADQLSFLINGNLKDILKAIGGKTFLATRDFVILKDGENEREKSITLRCNDNLNNFVILSFGSKPGEKDKTILATVAYHSDLSWISKSQKSSIIRETITNDISEKLSKNNNEFILIQLENVDDIISRKAFSFVELKTYSKIALLSGFLGRIPKMFKMIIYMTLFLFVCLSFAWLKAFIDNDTYIGIAATFVIALIIEIGIPLKDELSSKKTDLPED